MTGSVSSITLLIMTRLLQEIQKTIEKCFKNHFKKDNINPIEKFITPSKRLNKMIISKEVTKAVQKMANEKSRKRRNQHRTNQMHPGRGPSTKKLAKY